MTRSTTLLLAFTFTLLAQPCHLAWADNGAKLFEDNCSDCHHGKKKPLDQKHMTRAEWQKAIDTMIEKDKLDPMPSKEAISALLDWLTANYGPTIVVAGGAAAKPATAPEPAGSAIPAPTKDGASAVNSGKDNP